MTTGDWIGLSLQVVATVAAAAAAFAAWRSVVGVSKERKADARWARGRTPQTHPRADHRMVPGLFPGPAPGLDRPDGLAIRSPRHDGLKGPLPQCLALTTTDARMIMPDDVSGLAEAAIAEVEDAQARVWKGHTVELS
jgi:hypothetical protein